MDRWCAQLSEVESFPATQRALAQAAGAPVQRVVVKSKRATSDSDPYTATTLALDEIFQHAANTMPERLARIDTTDRRARLVHKTKSKSRVKTTAASPSSVKGVPKNSEEVSGLPQKARLPRQVSRARAQRAGKKPSRAARGGRPSSTLRKSSSQASSLSEVSTTSSTRSSRTVTQSVAASELLDGEFDHTDLLAAHVDKRGSTVPVPYGVRCSTTAADMPVSLSNFKDIDAHAVCGNLLFSGAYERFRRVLAQPPQERTRTDLDFVWDTLSNALFFRGIPQEFALEICRYTRLQTCAGGDIVYEQGSEGSDMFIISSGSAAAKVQRASGFWFIACNLYAGESFGECTIISSNAKHRRPCTIYAIEDCELIVLSEHVYNILRRFKNAETMERTKFFNEQLKVDIFRLVGAHDLSIVCSHTSRRTLPRNVPVVIQDRRAHFVHFIKRGFCRLVYRSPDGTFVELGELGAGDFFGGVHLPSSEEPSIPKPAKRSFSKDSDLGGTGSASADDDDDARSIVSSGSMGSVASGKAARKVQRPKIVQRAESEEFHAAALAMSTTWDTIAYHRPEADHSNEHSVPGASEAVAAMATLTPDMPGRRLRARRASVAATFVATPEEEAACAETVPFSVLTSSEVELFSVPCHILVRVLVLSGRYNLGPTSPVARLNKELWSWKVPDTMVLSAIETKASWAKFRHGATHHLSEERELLQGARHMSQNPWIVTRSMRKFLTSKPNAVQQREDVDPPWVVAKQDADRRLVRLALSRGVTPRRGKFQVRSSGEEYPTEPVPRKVLSQSLRVVKEEQKKKGGGGKRKQRQKEKEKRHTQSLPVLRKSRRKAPSSAKQESLVESLHERQDLWDLDLYSWLVQREAAEEDGSRPASAAMPPRRYSKTAPQKDESERQGRLGQLQILKQLEDEILALELKGTKPNEEDNARRDAKREDSERYSSGSTDMPGSTFLMRTSTDEAQPESRMHQFVSPHLPLLQPRRERPIKSAFVSATVDADDARLVVGHAKKHFIRGRRGSSAARHSGHDRFSGSAASSRVSSGKSAHGTRRRRRW